MIKFKIFLIFSFLLFSSKFMRSGDIVVINAFKEKIKVARVTLKENKAGSYTDSEDIKLAPGESHVFLDFDREKERIWAVPESAPRWSNKAHYAKNVTIDHDFLYTIAINNFSGLGRFSETKAIFDAILSLQAVNAIRKKMGVFKQTDAKTLESIRKNQASIAKEALKEINRKTVESAIIELKDYTGLLDGVFKKHNKLKGKKKSEIVVDFEHLKTQSIKMLKELKSSIEQAKSNTKFSSDSVSAVIIEDQEGEFINRCISPENEEPEKIEEIELQDIEKDGENSQESRFMQDVEIEEITLERKGLQIGLGGFVED